MSGKSLPQLSETTTVADTDEIAINDGGNPRRASILAAFTGRLFRAAFGSAAAPSISFATDIAVGLFRAAANVLGFATAGTERMRIDASGNVGIGTTSPAAALQVGGAVSEQRRATITSSGIATLVHTDNSQITVLNLDNPGVAASDNGVAVALRLATGNAALENAGVIAVVSETADYSGTGRDATMLFQTAADGVLATGIAIDSAQRVGVQTADPTAPLHVNGAARVGSSTVASLPSASTLGAGSMIFVSDETGGAVLAFSDGTAWRRVTDRAIVS